MTSTEIKTDSESNAFNVLAQGTCAEGKTENKLGVIGGLDVSPAPLVWTLSLQEPWFSFVKTGKKEYEGQLCRGLVRYMNIGDIIKFYCDDKIADPVAVEITSVQTFNNFGESLEKLGLQKTLPGVGSVSIGEKIYSQFASAQSQDKYGVCQIGIMLRPQN